METHSLQCPNCGAPVDAETGRTPYVCRYCGTPVHVVSDLPDGVREDAALIASVAKRDQLLTENRALRGRMDALQGPPVRPGVAPLYRGSHRVALMVVAGLALLGLCLIASALRADETTGTRALAAVMGALFAMASLAVLIYERRSSQWLGGLLQPNWAKRQSALTELQQLRQQYVANEQRIAALSTEISAAAHEEGG